MDSGNVFKGLFYGGFASCVAETGVHAPALAAPTTRCSR